MLINYLFRSIKTKKNYPTESVYTVRRWNTNSHTTPKWLKELERRQNHKSIPPPWIQFNNTHQNQDEIIIYETNSDHHSLHSPNRIGLQILALLVTTGLVANQIRHHGAGPVWQDSKSRWSDFQFKLWDKSTRIIVSISLITFTFWRSLKFLFGLSHTIKRITIKKSNLAQFRKLISMKVSNQKNGHTSALSKSIELNMYSIGSLDLIHPINKLYKFSIFKSIKLNDLINFNFLPSTYQLNSTTSSYQYGQNKADCIWLKYIISEDGGKEKVNNNDERKLESNTKLDPMAHHSSSDPASSLNSVALQIPTFANWGNSQYDLSATGVQSIFQDKIKSCRELLIPHDTKNQDVQNHHHSNDLDNDEKVKLMYYKLFGFDFRNSVWFNFNVLKSHFSSFFSFK